MIQCLQDANRRCHQHHKSRLCAASLLLSKGSKQEFVARFQTSELENWKVSSWQTPWLDLMNLYEDLQALFHLDEIYTVLQIYPLRGQLIRIRLRPHRCPYHSCKLQRGSSKRVTAKRVGPISPIGAIPAAFGPWNLSHPFGFLQGDKLWWRPFSSPKRWKWNEDGWSLWWVIWEFRDFEINFVNQLLESKSLQVLCLPWSPCHPWNSGSRPGRVEPRRPYDTLSVRLRASFLCSWEVPRTWSNWQTQKGNFPWMEIHLVSYHTLFQLLCAEKKQNKFQLHHKPSPIVTCWIRSEPQGSEGILRSRVAVPNVPRHFRSTVLHQSMCSPFGSKHSVVYSSKNRLKFENQWNASKCLISRGFWTIIWCQILLMPVNL